MVYNETPKESYTMFNKLFRRNQNTNPFATEQHKLDTLRINFPSDQLMQLHCDRMQSILDAAN